MHSPTQPEWLALKLVEPKNLKTWAERLRSQGKTIATLNGSFDLMHAGHLWILHQASQQADVLLVALNSDASIRKYKSPTRPMVPLKYRLEMMAAIGFVGAVTWFEETDPREMIALVKPDVHVNGAEYGNQCIEADTVRQCGARLHLVERIEGLATSTLIEKIKQCG